MRIEIELEFNAILDKEDVMPELEEWMEQLRFNHLIGKKITRCIE